MKWVSPHCAGAQAWQTQLDTFIGHHLWRVPRQWMHSKVPDRFKEQLLWQMYASQAWKLGPCSSKALTPSIQKLQDCEEKIQHSCSPLSRTVPPAGVLCGSVGASVKNLPQASSELGQVDVPPEPLPSSSVRETLLFSLKETFDLPELLCNHYPVILNSRKPWRCFQQQKSYPACGLPPDWDSLLVPKPSKMSQWWLNLWFPCLILTWSTDQDISIHDFAGKRLFSTETAGL